MDNSNNPINSFIKTIGDIDSEVVFVTKAAPKNDVEGLFFNMLMSLANDRDWETVYWVI